MIQARISLQEQRIHHEGNSDKNPWRAPFKKFRINYPPYIANENFAHQHFRNLKNRIIHNPHQYDYYIKNIIKRLNNYSKYYNL